MHRTNLVVTINCVQFRSKILLLEKCLKIYCALWSPIRNNTIYELIHSKNDVIEIIHDERIIKITASTVSLVVGGSLAIAGIALAPVTFGGSLALTVAGGVVSGVASLGGIGVKKTNSVRSTASMRFHASI